MNRIKKILLFFLMFYLGVGISYAGNPLEVFSGGRSLSYPAVPQNSGKGSAKVKIKGEDAAVESGDQQHTVAQEPDAALQRDKGMVSKGQDIPLEIPPDIQAADDHIKKQEDAEEPPDFIGTWRRTALYVDGAPNPQSPASMTLKKDSFVSSSTCTAEGILISGENTLTLVTTSTSCRGVPLPLTVSYHYEISKDKSTLSWFTANYSEVFVREESSTNKGLPDYE